MTAAAAMGRAWRVWRLRFRTRGPIACLLLLAALGCVAVYALGTGDFRLTSREVLDTLGGAGPPGAHFVVFELRLPRLLVGCAVGAALAVGGALLQSLTRNPLGSPDVVGFTVGAASGGILVILVFGGGALAVSLGAVAGGLATALAMYLLAMRGSGGTGTQLILVGIGVSAMLEAMNAYLLSRASVNEAQSASAWLVGSLNARGWEHLLPVAAALLVLGAVLVPLIDDLRVMELGEDNAASLGVHVRRTRFTVIAVVVGLTAAATATAGPVAFIALTAPPLARFLTRAPGPNVLASALTGALLLSVGDLVAQRLLAPTILPVGVMTGAIGGVYLCFLLLRSSRVTSR